VPHLPPTAAGDALKLAAAARALAPERGLATYGKPQERLTPAQLYSAEKASEALRIAEEALLAAERILKELGYGL